jgi:hypothetical protein
MDCPAAAVSCKSILCQRVRGLFDAASIEAICRALVDHMVTATKV